MEYIARFSILRSADIQQASTPPLASPLQADFAKAALTSGTPSSQVANLLTAFVTSGSFLGAPNPGLAQSATLLSTKFAAPAADLVALLKEMQTLAADPQALTTETQLSDSLLAMYWLPMQLGWDRNGLVLARKALVVGRTVDPASDKAIDKAKAIMALPLAPAMVRLPLRQRPAPAASGARGVRTKTEVALQALLKQRSEILTLAGLLRNARPSDVLLTTQVGARAAGPPPVRTRARAAATPATSVQLPLTDAMKAQLFAAAPNAMKTLGYAASDSIGINDVTAKALNLQTTIAAQLSSLSLASPWMNTVLDSPDGTTAASSAPSFTPAAPPSTHLANLDLIRIQDFYFIEQVWNGYAKDEISYIENVMPGEEYSRLFAQTTTTVDSKTDSTETITEQDQDLTTNTREDLQRQTTQAISSQASVSAGFHLGYSGAGVTLATDLNASYQNTQQASTTAAQDFTQEVGSQASQSLKKTVSQQTFHQVTSATKDRATHQFKNVGTTPIIGIYQFINKLYNLRTYLYDAKTVVDLVVPEPAALLLEQLGASGSSAAAAASVPTFNVVVDGIQRDTYLQYGALYGVYDLPAAPDFRITLSKTMSYQSGATDTLAKDVVAGSGQGQDLPLPDGYYAQSFRIQGSVVARDLSRDFGLTAFAGNLQLQIGKGAGNEYDTNEVVDTPSSWEQGSLGLAVTAFNASSYSVVFEIDCAPSGDGFRRWQNQVFEALQSGYEKMAADAANQARLSSILGPTDLVAPGVAQEVIARELKRCVISLISQQSFDWAGAIDEGAGAPGERLPGIDFLLAQQQADYIQFFELAFEWPLLQYVPYPYFWGRKEQWGSLLKIANDNAELLAFLTAGACRVVVPIREQWSCWVERFVATGQWPAQSDLLTPSGATLTPSSDYVTISDQIATLKANIPPGGQLLPKVTPVVVPTNMVMLSTDTALPQPAAQSTA